MFFNKRMFFDSLINLFICSFFYELSYKLYYVIDKGFFEIIGPTGLFKFYTAVLFNFNKHIYNGKVWNYLYLIIIAVFFMFVGLLVII